MMDEEEGELEEDDDEEKEQGQEDQEEQAEGQEEHDDDEDLYRKLIEDEFSDSDKISIYFVDFLNFYQDFFNRCINK